MFDYAIALTGGIATGKSTVASLFKQEGWQVLDADAIAHQVLKQETPALVKLFDKTILADNGEIDRKKLASIVFDNPQALKKLEAFMHPKIFHTIRQQASQLDTLKHPYIVDIPLFYEKGNYPIKKVLLVYAPQTLQIERLTQQKGYTQKEALQRINAQQNIEFKKEKATYILNNTSTLKELQKNYTIVKKKLLNDFT